MMFTSGEKRLLVLYHSGSVGETAAVVTDALADITEPDERAVAGSLLRKLECMDKAAFDSFMTESGEFVCDR